MNISDPVFDTLYGKALTATSVDQVKEMVRQGYDIFHDSIPDILLTTQQLISSINRWFQGFMGKVLCLWDR